MKTFKQNHKLYRSVNEDLARCAMFFASVIPVNNTKSLVYVHINNLESPEERLAKSVIKIERRRFTQQHQE